MIEGRNKKWIEIVMSSRLLKVSSIVREVIADQLLLFVSSLVISLVLTCWY